MAIFNSYVSHYQRVIGVDKDAISESVPSTSRPGSGLFRMSAQLWGVLRSFINMFHDMQRENLLETPIIGGKNTSKTRVMWSKQCHKPTIWEWFYSTYYCFTHVENMESNCPSGLAFKPSILGWYPPTQPPFFLVQPSGELHHDTPSFFLVQPIFLLENH